MSNTVRPHWPGWKPIAWLVGIAIALIPTLIFFDPLGWRAAKLIAVPQPHPTRLAPGDPEYVPFGNGLPTVVPLANIGQNEGLIQAVTFDITAGPMRTPTREPLYGKGPTIPVFFLSRHYDQKGQFRMLFRSPPAAPGKDEHTILEVAIVEPAWLGNTYIGKLTVHYAGGESLPINGVEIDVLADEPVTP